MKQSKKKLPSDYPLFSFRVDETTKSDLNKLIDKAVKKANKNLEEDDKVVRKNDVIVEALNIGLKEILKKK